VLIPGVSFITSRSSAVGNMRSNIPFFTKAAMDTTNIFLSGLHPGYIS
jgi:hypothetical protein